MVPYQREGRLAVLHRFGIGGIDRREFRAARLRPIATLEWKSLRFAMSYFGGFSRTSSGAHLVTNHLGGLSASPK